MYVEKWSKPGDYFKESILGRLKWLVDKGFPLQRHNSFGSCAQCPLMQSVNVRSFVLQVLGVCSHTSRLLISISGDPAACTNVAIFGR